MTDIVATSEPNSHIRQYLEYYLHIQRAPQYAVLLSAPWGAGKTFQARRIVSAIVGDENYVHVSLNGLATQRDIDDALVAAMYPWSAKRGARIGAAVGKAILKHAKIELPQIETSDLIDRANKAVYIFDDLERCRLPIQESLGYINQFVERDGCKVIILANEDQIECKKDYTLSKEKLIGKTLSVKDDFDGAFLHFLGTIDDESAKHAVEILREPIKLIYGQSNLQNLRILQQTMWDYARLYSELRIEHRAHEGAMQHLLMVFFALSFELKAGRIENLDLVDRTNRALAGMVGEKKEASPLAKANSRYPGIMLYDRILSDQVFYDMLALGIVDGSSIQSSLDRSSWFVRGQEPSWRTIWHSSERNDDEVWAAITAFQSDFQKRRFTKTGEILHVFGQMLKLAKIGAIDWPLERACDECKAYVADVRSAGKLEPLKPDGNEDIRFGSYDGLGFSQNDTQEFRDLAQFVREQRADAAIDGYPAEADALLSFLKSNPRQFVQEIAFGADRVATYARVPVLAAIDPKAFALELVALRALDFREVLLGLSARYDGARFHYELAAEREWAEALEVALLDIAAKGDAVFKDRISNYVKWTLTEQLDRFRQNSAEGADS